MKLSALLLVALLAGGCQQAVAPPEPDTSTPVPYLGRLICVGDSLTEGMGLEEIDAYPAQLQQRLHKDGQRWKVTNAGVSGETSTAALARLNWVMHLSPNAVILESGGNDALRGIDPEVTRKNLEAMVAGLQAQGVKVMLAGMRSPENSGKDYSEKFASLYPAVAQARKVELIPFFLEGVAGDPRLNQADRIHPTKEGYAIIVDRIAPQVESWLSGPRRNSAQFWASRRPAG